MPGPIDHPAVREQVRLLYLSNGKNLSEACRVTGIPLARAEKWKQRSPTSWDVSTVSDSVRAISDAAADSLSNYSKRSKHALAKAGTKAAEHLASEEVSAKEVLKSARQMKDVAGTLQTVLGWNEGKTGSGTLNLNVLGGQTAIQVVQGPAKEE